MHIVMDWELSVFLVQVILAIQQATCACTQDVDKAERIAMPAEFLFGDVVCGGNVTATRV